MITLNEQIQRLRDALVTCYNAIKRKGGTIPEAGERTLLNMPAAVMSIPQIHGVLTELNVTASGEYLPADYDADGFSKVTAEFDTSSLPKVKVSSFTVNNGCIDEDGRWEGENLIDTSEVISLSYVFAASKIKKINADNWNIRKVTNMNGAFINCTSLSQLSAIGWDTSNVEIMANIFRNCPELQELDIREWDVSSVTNISNFALGCNKMQSLIGDSTIDDVIRDNISTLKNLKVGVVFIDTILDRASLRALINGLADLTGQTTQTLTLGAKLVAKLTEEDIAIAVNKNWTIV